MTQEETYYRRNFLDLFGDSIRLARMAQEVHKDEQNDDETEFSCARASIMSTVFSLECAANCCLEIMPIGSGFKKDIDKLPFLSKFEVFLCVMSPGKTLDRGRNEVQLVQELKTVRDSFTHPKVKRTHLRKVHGDPIELQAGVGIITPIIGTGTQYLKLPKNITWDAEHAISVLHAAAKFMNYFFIELCSYDSDTINHILLSNEEVSFPSEVTYGRLQIPEFMRAMEQWKLNLDFLGG